MQGKEKRRQRRLYQTAIETSNRANDDVPEVALLIHSKLVTSMKPSINERLLIRLLVIVISKGNVIRLDPEFARFVQRSVRPIVPDDTR